MMRAKMRGCLLMKYKRTKTVRSSSAKCAEVRTRAKERRAALPDVAQRSWESVSQAMCKEMCEKKLFKQIDFNLARRPSWQSTIDIVNVAVAKKGVARRSSQRLAFSM
jgi:hypothetical protein